jgi:dUTP pyrophosphatase
MVDELEIPVFKFAVGKAYLDKYVSLLPSKGTDKATGWDVKAAQDISLRPGQYAKISLGFRIFAPDGWWLELRPRSSSFAKKQLHCLYGVIDEDYEGECLFACQYIPDVSAFGKDLKISFGDAIGQIVPVKRQEMVVEQVTDEEYAKLIKQRKFGRGDGGFGSTSK